MRLIQQLLCFWGFLAAFVEAGRSDAPVNQLFRTHSIYISLNYLRVTNRENKYVRFPRPCPTLCETFPFSLNPPFLLKNITDGNPQTQHWQLFVTDGEKKGKGYHITNVDATGKQVPFFYDSYDGNDPTRSSSMILLYSVLDAPAVNTFEVSPLPLLLPVSTSLDGNSNLGRCFLRSWPVQMLLEKERERFETTH